MKHNGQWIRVWLPVVVVLTFVFYLLADLGRRHGWFVVLHVTLLVVAVGATLTLVANFYRRRDVELAAQVVDSMIGAERALADEGLRALITHIHGVPVTVDRDDIGVSTIYRREPGSEEWVLAMHKGKNVPALVYLAMLDKTCAALMEAQDEARRARRDAAENN